MAQQREFGIRKEVVLKALSSEVKDKSRKGGVDAPIACLISSINSHSSFFTTSSCSGRISIFLEQSSALLHSDPYHVPEDHNSEARAKVKQGGSWIYVSHEAAEADEVVETVGRWYQETKEGGLLMFRFEPFILALECSSLAAAQRLVACAMGSGFRESGVSSVGKRIVVAVRSSIRLEVPIGEKGKLLVPEEYLRFLTASANKKLLLNQERIDRFMSSFSNQFSGDIPQLLSTNTKPMANALGHIAGPSRWKGVSSQVRDKVLSSLETRQSKILLRIHHLETFGT